MICFFGSLSQRGEMRGKEIFPVASSFQLKRNCDKMTEIFTQNWRKKRMENLSGEYKIRQIPLDTSGKPDIILRASGFGLRASGFGRLLTGNAARTTRA
jgi:hypothetical protein